ATLRTGTHIAKLMVEHNRVIGVQTSNGEKITADIVVSCAGRWTDQVSAMAGSILPMAPTYGLLATTSKIPATLTSLVHTPDVNLRPEGGSRLLLASYDIDVQVSPDMPETALTRLANEVLDHARQIVPALAWAKVDARVVGTRSIPADGFPAVGWMPELEGFYTVATHSGVTMGPLLGRIAASEILTGRPDPLLETFRPARLLANRTAQTVDT
ncbi:MAG: FAD-binding oxidoreductase, partial [Thermomicrobiales bacterium]